MILPVQLSDKLETVIDSVGLVQPTASTPEHWASGNGILYTGIVCALLARLDALDPYRDQFIRALTACEPVPGVLIRHPLNTSQEGPDDFIGAGAASYFLKIDLAARILTRGRRFGFYFPEQAGGDYDLRAWLGRFESVWAGLAFSATETPLISQQIILGGSVALSPWKNEDEPILSWLTLEVAERQSLLMVGAGVWFRRRLKNKYPNGMVQVFETTFGPGHAIPELMKLVLASS